MSIQESDDKLQIERERLNALLENAPVAVIVARLGGEIALVNQEARRLIAGAFEHQGSPKTRDFLARWVYTRPDGSEYRLEDLPLLRALNQGEHVRAEELQFRSENGDSRTAIVSAVPIRDKEGKIIEAIGIAQDIGPIEQAASERSDLAAAITHELRIPLSAIKGAAVIALTSRGVLSPRDIKDLFSIVDRQSDLLTEIINNISDISSIGAGSLSVSPEPVGLAEILEEAGNRFKQGGLPYPIDLSVSAGLPPVMADRRRLGQVIANLLQNAARFSPPETPIVISVDPPDAGAHLTVRVQDKGMGIPQDKLHLLFQNFSHMRDRGASGLAGAGLGLAICKGIIEAHGGRIRAESPGEGQGTTIIFTLPIAAQQQEQPPQQAPQDIKPAEQAETKVDGIAKVRRRGDQRRVLVVDDDPHLLKFLRRFLGEAGYQVTVNTDPGKTANLVELEEPDLVLLDIGFPGANGFDVLARIREFSAIPVIFLTGKNAEQDVVRALKMGADDYVTKPFASSELLARVETALRKRGPGEEQTRPQYTVGELMVNFAERRVMVAGSEVSLTATEYKLLHELAANAGRVMTYDQLLRRVWGIEYAGETNLVRSFILSLRRKLQDDGKAPKLIRTERGVGYRMPKAANA